MDPVIQLQGITKRFPGVLANDAVNLDIYPGEVHGLLGENGAGKTTLMKILSGLYHPDEGRILFHGNPVNFASPREALAAGIGMIHQHFMLIPTFSVAENLTLGAEVTRLGLLDRSASERMVKDLSDRFGLAVDPQAYVRDISVGQQQRVEILKVLYRGAEVIILDEPTAVLTPQEVEDLYRTVDALRAAGHTILFISHKLNEVLRFTDRVTVLRDGRVVGACRTAEMTAGGLAEMMVGREVAFKVKKEPCRPGRVVLKVDNLTVKDFRGLPAVREVSLEVHAGEIVGIAGVEGNGQTELQEALAGLVRPTAGQISLDGCDITSLPVAERFRRHLAHIPEDRLKRGLVQEFSLAENAILGFQDQAPFASGLNLRRHEAERFTRDLMARFDVRAPNERVMAGGLSGGNQQKLVLARELARQPVLLIAAQPTRGLDVGATEFVHQKLVRLCQEGAGVLLFSLDLNEIMQLSDRILVMYEGRLVAECCPENVTEKQLGVWMTGGRNPDEHA